MDGPVVADARLEAMAEDLEPTIGELTEGGVVPLPRAR